MLSNAPSPPILGVDFDNTVINYQGVFQKLALEQGLVPDSLFQTQACNDKIIIRDYLNAKNMSEQFTELQGFVYGKALHLARPYPGVREGLKCFRDKGWEVCLISHKSKIPLKGPAYDLHAAAWDFLKAEGLIGQEGFAEGAIFFEPSLSAKITKIWEKRCDIFMDDLPEVLSHPDFSPKCHPILFDPEDHYPQQILPQSQDRKFGNQRPQGRLPLKIRHWQEMKVVCAP